ncbi:MAG TPA: hypothetical protein PLC80_13340 [Draconibacterium sp.]|nr:hypothetical protein [Draconibacterium sp.]
MEYKIEQIGSKFSDKGIAYLEQKLTARAKEGYKFHSVIHITKSGCLGTAIGEVTTYLAVYVKE